MGKLSDLISWISMNRANIIVILILAVIVALDIAYMVRQKKKGIGSCGNVCANCSHQCGQMKVDERFLLKKNKTES